MSKLLYRILSGKILAEANNEIYTIYPLSYSDRYLAECLYEESLEEFLQFGCLSKNDVSFKALLFREKLRFDYDKELKRLESEIENLKVELYEFLRDKRNADETRKKIARLNEEIGTILYHLHQKDNLTAEGMADLEKTKFIIRKSLKRKVSEPTLEKILFWLSKNYIKEEDFRKIARSSLFSNIMNAGKAFGNFPLTDEQVTLMYWHKFYTGVWSHPERPSDNVIEEDWGLDGWCISQSKKNKMADAQSYVESKISSSAVANSQEVFIPRRPDIDPEKVMASNTPMANAYIKAKTDAIEKGKLDVNSEQRLSKSFGLGK